MNVTMQKFGYPDTLIKEYEHWAILLKPEQTTIGTVVIANKSDASHLGELGTEEWAEFAKVSSNIETALINAFQAEKFNYLALMMKDPNVHFHVVPRYSKTVMFNNQEYFDIDWPKKTELEKIELSEKSFNLLLQTVQEAIK